VLKETIPAVHPKAKMIPACILLAISRARNGTVTYQDNIRERKEEKRPLEVPQLLHQRALLVARVYFANTLRGCSICRSKTLLTIFLVGGLTHVIDNRPMLGVWKLITFVEEEARKHSLLETAEK
jgi:hypothetical protein